MPIKPENKARYPKNWKDISDRIKRIAYYKCEFCSAPQYGVGQRIKGKFCLAKGNFYIDMLHYSSSYKEAKELCNELNEWNDDPKYIVIVLTVAHLDHTPENIEDENLKSLCQYCHLKYDANHHAQTAYATRKANAKTLDMFME